MQRASAELIDFISYVPPEFSADIGQRLTNCVSYMKALNQHGIYLDGGKSYRKFWQKGDEIIEDLEQFILALKA